jgi:HlyD family secretion protein
MDRALPNRNKKKFKVTIIIIGISVLLSVTYFTFFRQVVLNVSKNDIRIREVVQDNFEEYISFQGQVEPLHSVLVNIVEGGAVQEIFVENGAMVKIGQPLVRLYNPNTEFNYLSQETSIIEQMNNLNVAKLNIRSQELNLTKDLISIEHDYKDAELLYNLHKKMYEQEVLSKSDWDKTKEAYRYQQQRKTLMEESIEKEKQTNDLQMQQVSQALEVMNQSLQKLRENKENFLLSAPISGRLSSFEALLGKTYQGGESIGKIDVLKGYKLVAQVDEFYLDKVIEGQTGQIDLKGQITKVEVKKILPEVKNGRFEVQLEFSGDKELKLQEGTSYGVRLFLSGKEKKLLLPKGNFYADTKGEWVYVLKDNKAERRIVELGRENPAYYEIISGLEKGEQVIVSTYKDFLQVKILNIQQ